MSNLNQKHVNKIEKFLNEQELTFKPLREEMIDHMLGDLESQIEKGISAEEAWKNLSNNIPEHHFKTLQKDTMEAINKRFNVSKIFSILSLVLLVMTSVFKLLHLQGAAVLLILSMVAIAISFVVSSISGIRLYKEKRGGIFMMITIAGILLFFFSWVLHILNFPEAHVYKTISVIILLIIFPVLTIYFNSTLKSSNNILAYLHKKHIPGIERFLFSLLFIAIAMRLTSFIFQYPPYISKILLILTVCSAGLQFFALNWHPQQIVDKNKIWKLAALIIAFVCFIIPTMGSLLDLSLRILLTTSFYVIAGFIAISRTDEQSNKRLPAILIVMVSLVIIGWALIRAEVIDPSFNMLIFNIPILLCLIAGVFFSRKHSQLRTYMIIVLAHYLYEFPDTLGLW